MAVGEEMVGHLGQCTVPVEENLWGREGEREKEGEGEGGGRGRGREGEGGEERRPS